MSTEYERKYAKAVEELDKTPLGSSSCLPLSHRLMKKTGVESRPPHYNSLLSNVVRMGVFFAIVWGLFMWLFVWNRTDMTVMEGITSAMTAGLIYGTLMGIYYRHSSRKHSLTAWEKL